MKRFFLVTAFASVFSILVTLNFNTLATYSLIGAALLLVIGLILYLIFKAPYAVLAVTFSISYIVMLLYSDTYCSNMLLNNKKYTNKEFTITAVVCEEPNVYSDYSSVVVKTIKNKNIDDKINVLIYYDNKSKLQYNDIIKFKIKLKSTDNKSYYADKVFLKGTAKKLKITETNRENFYSKAISFRQYISDIFIGQINDNVVGIPIGMLTGNRRFLSDGFYNNVKSVGMTHVMAVSGLHISIICLSVVMFLRKKFKLGNWIPAVVGIILVVLMAAISGFSGSILRAGIMYLVVFTGNIISRKADSLNSLGIAVTSLLIYNPFNVFSVSLALSALGTFGILAFASGLNDIFCKLYPFDNFLKKPIHYLFSSLSVTLSATLFIIPISLFTFGYISTISPIVNIVLSPIVYLCLMFSLLAVLLSFVPGLNVILLFIVQMLSNIFRGVVDYFSGFNFICFYKDDVLLYVVLAITLIIICSVFFFGKTKAISIILSIVLCIVLPISCIAQGYINSNKINYYFVGANSGSIMLLESSENYILVSSTADINAFKQIKSIINQRLSPQIDLLVVPTESARVLPSLLEYFDDYNIKNFLLCDNNFIAESNCFDDSAVKIWRNISLKSDKCIGGYNLYFDVGEEQIIFDMYTAKADRGDYILTATPKISYKINGNNAKYLITCNHNNRVVCQAICRLGGKAVYIKDNEIIFAKQFNNKVLKFVG